jgi:hypothetical protein
MANPLPLLTHPSRPIDEIIDWRVAMSSSYYRLTRTYRTLDDAIRAELLRRAPSWFAGASAEGAEARGEAPAAAARAIADLTRRRRFK